MQQKGKFNVGSSSPNAHKKIIGGLKSSLAKNMFQANGSLVELDSILVENNEVSGYLILDRRKYFLVGKKDAHTIKANVTGKASGKG